MQNSDVLTDSQDVDNSATGVTSISSATNSSLQSSIIVQGLQINQTDLETVKQGNMINDTVVAFLFQ